MCVIYTKRSNTEGLRCKLNNALRNKERKLYDVINVSSSAYSAYVKPGNV